MSVSLEKPSQPSGGDFDLNALRLLRVVHVRRALRALAGVELLAIAVWAAYSLSLEAYYEEGSTNWERIDDETGPGFLVILIALAVTVVAFVVAGRAGATGRVARQLVRLAGRGREPAVRPNTSASAFRARLRRRGYVQPAAVGLLLMFGLLAVLTSTSAWPAWQANHGHGGTVVTITDSTSITSERGVKTNRNYFIGTPDGTAIAESGRPREGQRWTIVRDLFGNLQAYRVGAYDYLLVGFLFLLSAAFVLGALAWQAEAVHTERRLRRAAGDGDLARDVAALAGGARARLLLDGQPAGVLGLPERAGRNPRRLLRVRRLATGGPAVVVVAGVIALLVLQQLALLGAPPDRREAELPYLRAAGWDPQVYVSYTNTDTDTRQLREWAGRGHADDVAQVRTLLPDRLEAEPPGSFSTPSADLTVARVGDTPAATLVAGWQDYIAGFTDDATYRVRPATGLPPGWSGAFVQTSGSTTRLYAFRVEAGTSLEIEMDDDYYADGKDGHYSAAQVTGWVAGLAAAIEQAGVTRFEQDTVQPEHA